MDCGGRMPRFPPACRVADKGVVRRYFVGQRTHVDTQDLAQKCRQVLPISGRIAAAAPVTGSDVKHAIDAELQLTAVVIAKQAMGDGQDADRRRLGAQEGLYAGGHRKGEAFDGNVAIGISEIDEYIAVGCELRVERQRQHAALAGVAYTCRNVEHGRLWHTIHQFPYSSGLLDDINVRPSWRRRQKGGRYESRCHYHESELQRWCERVGHIHHSDTSRSGHEIELGTTVARYVRSRQSRERHSP